MALSLPLIPATSAKEGNIHKINEPIKVLTHMNELEGQKIIWLDSFLYIICLDSLCHMIKENFLTKQIMSLR